MARKEFLSQFVAPPWEPERSEYLVLWHGTTDTARKAIERKIDLARCAVNTDFGRGFYLTTLERQAKLWAWKMFANRRGKKGANTEERPVVLRFRLRRFSATAKRASARFRGLDSLNHLAFVRAAHDNEDFWSLVRHCRSSIPANPRTSCGAVIRDHRRGSRGRGWYDVASGPVAAFWEQRVAMADSDQFGFHTPAAIAILQDLIVAGTRKANAGQGDPDFYCWELVT